MFLVRRNCHSTKKALNCLFESSLLIKRRPEECLCPEIVWVNLDNIAIQSFKIGKCTRVEQCATQILLVW